ncbi:16S rRNA (cytidine(1402)-2'-O)-methyltransferase [Candidatus Wolfebacteria bacterium]|nr:16S rRNA (cytidine(1402)-2'-O)-methyltransferase [Candidatus Wolfebacteria bacterium]
MTKLYVVATPIGNLEDITLRALRTLKEADVILAEDTRVTRKLLAHYDIHTPVERFDAKVENQKVRKVSQLLEEGKSIALVSDAGTPTISDPGSKLVAAVHTAGYEVVATPGPSALTAALSISGLPSSEFLFLGFLPHKKGRKKLFQEIVESERTVVFYESPHRIMKTLLLLDNSRELSSKYVVVARELTKMYEEVISGTAQEVLAHFQNNPEKVKGEFVIMVAKK